MDSPSPLSVVYRFGRFEFDPERRRLTDRGLKVRLPEQSAATLLKLLERPCEIVTREELRQAIWSDGTHVEFEGSLNAIVKRLRAALQDDADNPRFIETLPRRGYRFIAPVTAVQLAPSPSLPASAESAPLVHASDHVDVVSPTPQKHTASVLAAGSLALALIVVGIFLFTRLRHESSAQPSRTSAAVSPSHRRSVAVLGFRNLSANPKDAWLSTALTEMFSTELAAGDQLRLVPGEEVARLQLDLPQADTLERSTTSRLGQALDADVLVLGSYAAISAGKQRELRLDVRLQDARTSEILFETAQTGSLNDVFQLVTAAGGQMRDRLGISPVRQEDEAGVLASLPVNPEAARFYALGLARLRAFEPLPAKDLLIQATQAEPRFPLAHSMLAEAWEELGYQPKAIAEAKIAVGMSAGLPQSQKLEIQGKYYELLGRTDRAVEAYRALFAYYPDCLDCGLRLASAQMAIGHLTDALATIARLRNLPSPESDDPRIDFVEQAAAGYSDRPRQLVLLHRTLDKARKRGLLWLYARARLAECSDLGYLGKTAEAMAACREAGDLFVSLGDQMGVVRTLILQAARQSDSGDQQLALATFERALRTAQSLGGVELVGAVLNGIGNTYERMNRFEDAARSFRLSSRKYQEAGNIDGVFATSSNLGDVLAGMGQLAEADASYQQSLRISLAESPARSCYPRYSLAALHLTMGDMPNARAWIQPALKDCAALGVARYTASAIGVLGDILIERDRLAEAREKHQQALAIFQQTDSQDLMPGAWGSLAMIAMEQNDFSRAQGLLEQSIANLRKENNLDGIAGVDVQLSRLCALEQRPSRAREVLDLANRFSRSLHDPELNVAIAIQDARLLIDAAGPRPSAGSLSRARAELQSALVTATRLRFYHDACEARLALAESELHSDPAAARTSLLALAKETHARGYDLLSRKATALLARTPQH